ncbi:hypothetical protein CCP2SC5_2750001 [Azospirillaceae bacterium]
MRPYLTTLPHDLDLAALSHGLSYDHSFGPPFLNLFMQNRIALLSLALLPLQASLKNALQLTRLWTHDGFCAASAAT